MKSRTVSDSRRRGLTCSCRESVVVSKSFFLGARLVSLPRHLNRTGSVLGWAFLVGMIPDNFFGFEIGPAATAGTTGATVKLTLTFSTQGVPLAGAGLPLVVESIVGMGRTALNVTGQALVLTVIVKCEGIVNRATFGAELSFDGAQA